MGVFNLKKPEYKGRRFVVFDDSSAIQLNPAKKHMTVIAASGLTIVGVPVVYLLLKNERGVSPDLFAVLLFCVLIAWLWTQIINTIVEISIKENKIFFADYISNLKYFFIPDIVLIEKKKSIICILTRTDKLKINSDFAGIDEFVDKIISINPQIEKKGFTYVK